MPMDQRKIEKTRELIDGGFYDDPETLEVLFECCAEGILCDMGRTPAKATPARIRRELPRGDSRRGKVRLIVRRRCTAAP
jgi:hypothetical protein